MGFGDFLNNVVNSIPGVGHVKGIGHALVGDREGAREAFQAANSCTSGVLNSIPVVGHAKGLLHVVAGDREGAAKAFLSATRSSLVMGAAVVAGPAGAAAAAIGTGVGTDAVVSVVTREPVGYIKNFNTICDAKGVTDVIAGVGKMALDVGCDVAAGSAGGAISSAAKMPGKQVIHHTSKQIAQSVEKTVVRNLENQVVGYALENRTNRRSSISRSRTNDSKQVEKKKVLPSKRKKRRTFKSIRYDDEFPSSSSGTTASSDTDTDTDTDSSDDEDETDTRRRYIYFFRCLNGKLKVGRTRRLKERLNEHRLKGRINYQSEITVWECSNEVAAETQILREPRILKARITKIRKTEFLDADVDEDHVFNVISTEVEKVNGQAPHFKKFKLYDLFRYFP